MNDIEEEKKEQQDPIPVTILSGFLGSGKTTLLKHVLESMQHKLKVAVIVNDMAELNIDASLVRNTAAAGNQEAKLDSISTVVQTKREIVSLQNGCICCTLRGDLIREIARIRSSNQFDYVLIESTGIAEPQQVAQSFVFDPSTAELASSEKEMLWTQAKLDTCVTVIDAHAFPMHMSTLKYFSDAFEDGLDKSTPEGIKEGEKSICTLMMEQVEFANIILLNKTDLVATKEELDKTIRAIRSLNPSAKIIPTEYSKIDLKNVLNTGIFDMKVACKSPGWMQSIREIEENPDAAHSELDEYNIGSFVYRARIPFHPSRIAGWVDSILHYANEYKDLSAEQRTSMEKDPKYAFMLKHYGNILRAKGFIWLADHDSFMIGFAQSGRVGSIYPIMPWYTIIPKEQWGVEEGSDDYQVIDSKFEEPHGDRRQEIVFIGIGLNKDKIKQQLDTCLLTKKELKKYNFYSDKESLAGK
jgi:G3E family GTPase